MSLASCFSGLQLGAGCCHFSGRRLQASRPATVLRPVAPALVECAHKKGGGSTKNGRDSNAQRRGVKVYGGQRIKAGGIIVRQLGTVFHPGDFVGCGKDHTLYALKDGIVIFKKTKYMKKVSVINTEDYVIPEGQRVQPGSRKWKRHEQFPPRSELRAQANADLLAALAQEQPAMVA